MSLNHETFEPADVTNLIWQSKYRQHDVALHEDRLDQTRQRVAKAVAEAESTAALKATFERRFRTLLNRGDFIPGGRILAGAGTDRRITLANCFVMGRIHDSMEGIFKALKEGTQTMQQGGGIGYDFTTLRPSGSRVHGTERLASGPVSFMHLWDSVCTTVLSTGNRRGAMMATLRCDHPDIELFIQAKASPGKLNHLNLSVLITDDFLKAVKEDELWPLIFPASSLAAESGEIIYSQWPGSERPIPCQVIRRIRARVLWQKLLRHSYRHGEPGVLFIDTINRENNLGYCEYISATNPCGEIPLPPYGACVLGSLNLVNYIRNPFTPTASLDIDKLRRTVPLCVRFLDNAISISAYPLPDQAQEASGTRRLGLGITGLADALIMLGLHYGSPAARDMASHIMQSLCFTAYRASIKLAQQRGAFPYFQREPYLGSAFIQRLPKRTQRSISEVGIRNSHLLAIAPTGSISLLAGNVSPGLEPVFGLHHHRRFSLGDGRMSTVNLQDWAFYLWRSKHPHAPLPRAFVTANELTPSDHLLMQACLQPFVDNAISKTINLSAKISFSEFQRVFETAHKLGLKGLTVFRRSQASHSVLS